MIKRLIVILAVLILPASSFAAVTYSAGNISATLDATGNDRYYSGVCNITGTTLTLVYTVASQRYSLFRFPSVSIPKGATITSAKLMVYPASGSGSVNVTSTLLDYDNCTSTDLGGCVPSLTGTTAVHAITGAWATARLANSSYDITGLESLVQAWIDRAGYEYNYGIGLKLSGAGVSHTIDDFAYNGSVLSVDFTGGEPTLAVHMADPHSRTKQYIKCVVYNTAADDKLVIKLDGSAVYNTAIGGSGEQKEIDVLVDYTSLSAGAHTIDVYLTNAAAEEYVTTHFDKDYTTTHSGAPAVGLDENNSLIVGGSTLFFPVGDFFTSPNALAPGAGQNDIVPLTNISISMGYVPPTAWDTAAGRSYSIDIASYINELATLESLGRPIMGPGPRWEGSSKLTANLGKMASNNSNCVDPVHADECGYARRLSSASAQYVWNWMDEPNLGGDDTYTPYSVDNDPYWGLHEWHEAVKAVDTDHPTGNLFSGISNEFAEDFLIRDSQYAYYFNSDTTVSDLWIIDYYPYEYFRHAAAPDLENLALSVDNAHRYNYGLIPIWIMGECEDLRDYYGYIADYWRVSTYEPIQKQIAEEGRLYRSNTGTTCTTGTVEPTWANANDIGETITDNTCVWECEGTRTARVLNVESWDSGTFQVGERVCASAADGGCAVTQGVIGRPRQGGSFTQTAASYIRTPESLNNYQINQLVLSSRDGTGTFTDGMHLVGQTSGATCTLASPTLYRLGPWSTEKSYDWTPHPTPEQIANAIWIPIIHGARGVAYFPLFTYITDENKVEMAAQLAKLTALKDIILEGMSDKITPANYQQWASATVGAGYRVDYTVRDYGAEVWIFASRLKTKTDPVYPWPDPTDTNSIPATIPLDYLAGGETITVYGEGRTITADADGFTDNFTDYDVHIYSVGGEAVPSYALTVTLAGAGTGVVTSSPAAINCGSTCTGNFIEDSVITLTATPTGADTFTGWSGDCSGTDPCAVTMTAAKNVTATFVTAVPPDHIVTISHTGTGTGATDPIAGEHIYAEEAAVSVTQTPTDANMTFTGWSGTCGCTGTAGCSFTMPTSDCTVIAEWTEDQIYRLDVIPSEHGERIISDVGGIDCGNGVSETETCYAVFYAGEEVTLTYDVPVSRENPQFTGACSGQTCVVTMDGDKIVGLNTRSLRPSMGRGGSSAKGGALGTSSAAQIIGN